MCIIGKINNIIIKNVIVKETAINQLKICLKVKFYNINLKV